MEPAQSIIHQLGGAVKVAAIVEVDKSRVYKWCKPKTDGGTDGLVPSWHITKLLEFASKNGICLSAEDFFPAKEKGVSA